MRAREGGGRATRAGPSRAASGSRASATRCASPPRSGVPAAFVYDDESGMRMVLAPKLLTTPGAETKTVRLQDPEGLHPNQLFEFNTSVRVEYLRAASRTMETLELHGKDAYCMQALRRSVVPTCWASLD